MVHVHFCYKRSEVNIILVYILVFYYFLMFVTPPPKKKKNTPKNHTKQQICETVIKRILKWLLGV